MRPTLAAATGRRVAHVLLTCRRLAYRCAFRLLQVWWFVRRPQTYGVKLVVCHEDRVLFVRHTYGRRQEWELPGGGRHRGEAALAAATREGREELGLVLEDWEPVGVLHSEDFANAELTVLATAVPGPGVATDPGEIADVRWAPVEDPPLPLGRHAGDILALPELGMARGRALARLRAMNGGQG